jgi:hypothetical protein
MYAAMTDHALLGKKEYIPALNALWEDITRRRVFVTGGIGPSGHNEGFTVPYDIPTTSAYQETCASIALCLWAHRMFLLHGDAKYMAQFERTLYNAVLAGVSTSGDRFFYVNPLATRGGHQRTEWFSCACCPPNVLRFFASLGGYVYGVRGDTVYVNLFAANATTLEVNGGKVQIEMGTGYPFDGEVGLRVRNTTTKDVKIAIRRVFGLRFGEDAPTGDDGYGRMTVPAGQTAMYDFEIPLVPRRVYADPRVGQLAGRVAFMRGPLVYAAEAIDNPGGVTNLVLPPSAEFEEERAPFGVTIVHVNGLRATGQGGDGLYRDGPTTEPARISMRPYFLWGNRSEAGGEAMKVWLPESVQLLDPTPVPGIKAIASKVGKGDGVAALFDRLVGESSRDTTIPRFTFWPAKGDGTQAAEQWIRYDFDALRRLSRSEVMWFDDTGQGECRVPESCAIEYLEGEAWKPVPNPKVLGVAKDAVYVTAFDPVTTQSLRLRVRMQKDFSAGVLEWSVAE